MMGKLRNNEKGFGVVEGLLIVAVVVLLGVVGYMVYKNHNKTATTATNKAATTTKTTTPVTTPTQPATQTSPFVNVIQEDSSVTQVTPDKIAKTTDEANILTALHNTCTGSSTYVTVNHIVFDGNPNFKQDGNYAEINAGVCNSLGKTIDDVGGSGSANYLHKNSSGTWVFDTASQMAPDCAKVDGLGYPTTIITSCYDGSTSRAPR